MNREESKKLVSNIELTDNDKRPFQAFTPIGKLFQAFIGMTMLAIDTGVQTYRERDYTSLKLAPEDNQETSINFVLAFNANVVHVGDDSLREIGRKSDVDTAVASLAAFTVDDVEFTGEYPARRSVAAEECGFDLDHEMTTGDWNTLNTKYESDEKYRKAAVDESYGATELFEIPKISITPIQ